METTICPPPEATSNPDTRRELTRRVANTVYFNRSPKLRAFLLYVCENAISGTPENVRERLIGSRVFGRPSEYNSGDDNIVRVEARELRKRLGAYFTAEGRHEPVVIDIPRGSYLPVFQSRSTEDTAPDNSPPTRAASLTEPARRFPLLPMVLGVCAAALVWLALDDAGVRRGIAASPESRMAAEASDYSFYRELLGSLGATPNRETLVVMSNPRVIVSYGTDAPLPASADVITIPNELKHSLANLLRNSERNLRFQVINFTREDYTGMGEAVSGFHVGRLMSILHRPVRLTQSRFLNWEHVPRQDLIVLGGPASNDWTYQNGARSNFNFELNGIENRNPGPGESRHYTEGGDRSNKAAVTEYGVIKMLTSPYGFRTLLLAATNSTGTAGVGEFFSDPSRMKNVYNLIRQASPGKAFPAEWEVLVRVTERDHIPVQTTVIAVRPAGAGQKK